MRNAGLVVALGLIVMAAAGCSRLAVESNPPGAQVVWSPDGVQPYQPWPPGSWELVSSNREGVTPFRSTGGYRDSVFVTVEKEGYRRPMPKLVQLYGFRRESLHFDLQETPDAFAARMREEGRLLYQGEWVDPDEAGVVEYQGVVMTRDEAHRQEQLAQGLVEYDGEWMTPEEADERETERRLAEGYVRFKGRWVTEEVMEEEMRIDEEVASIAEEADYYDLPSPRVVGRQLITDAQMQLYNSTGQVVRFLFSGPVSREVTLAPYRSRGVRTEDRIILPPGEYGIAIVPTGRDGSGRDLRELAERLGGEHAAALSTDPVYGAWELSAGTQVSFNYAGAGTALDAPIDDTDIVVPEFDIDAPEIEIPEFERRQQQGRRPPGAPPQQ